MRALTCVLALALAFSAFGLSLGTALERRCVPTAAPSAPVPKPAPAAKKPRPLWV